MEYLYPKVIDPQLVKRYLDEFAALVDEAQARGMRVVVIKPPIPDRVHKELPDEASFDAALSPLLAARSVELHDLSHEGNDPKFFYDTDHLNRDGVLNFFSQHLGPLLVP